MKPVKTAAPHPAPMATRVRKILWILISVFVAVGLATYALLSTSQADPTTPTLDAQLVRGDSHRLNTPATEKAVLVEFLDFECGPCRTAVQLTEELKEEYGDKVTFVHRHFPLPGHPNASNAALAAEAAAQQGKYEEMYFKLFSTQPQWANRQESQASAFRGYAQELGLDMAQYDAAITDNKTQEKIRNDIRDGKTLGVNGTPTFFLNGKKLAPSSSTQLHQLLENATK